MALLGARGRSAFVRTVGLLLVLLATSACREGLAFREDARLMITEPADRAAVTVPFKLTWTARDLPRGARFAVLIDRTPPPAGERLDWLARRDPRCARAPTCPDEEYLRGLRVYLTADTSLLVSSVPRPARRRERELHDLAVILLDPDGRRIGETAAAVTVEVRRDG